MFLNSKTGVLLASVLVIAGCTSPKEPYYRQFERPQEQCFSASEFARMGGDTRYHEQNGLISNDAAFIDGFPNNYVVKKGDTLWDISGRFLRKPWYWRQIWYSNPQIKNPDLIYPGDVLNIVVVNGQRYLTITESYNPYHGIATGRQTSDGRPVVRYEPGMNDPTLPGAASQISQSILGPFLNKTRIVGVEALPGLPFIFGSGEQYLTLSQQRVIYTHGIEAERGTKLGVYRPGAPVLDYDVERQKKHEANHKPEILGQQMRYIGEVSVLSYNPINGLTELQPTSVLESMQEGDVLMYPESEMAPVNFFPRLPSAQCQRGYILNSAHDQQLSITEYDTVVTSFGISDGAQVGDVWAIERPGQVRLIQNKPVIIPGETIGFLMIYKVYDRVSLAVVLDSTQPISETDYLVRP
ncbi:LysM peptidoglycan-binding domain-containing protein [Cardiobacteriaceae bacterium TAE3-ERU3]|nr:LysM peptidoglycan-binding domain-containing protein [Cardiobacteriaceae bacterium TAE3-ERU3]